MKLTPAFFLALLPLLPLAGGETVSASRNIACRQDALEVRRTPFTVLDGAGKDLSVWKAGNGTVPAPGKDGGVLLTGKKDGEGMLDLQVSSGELKIPASPEKFIFTMDAVLLHAREAVPGWEGRYVNKLDWLDKNGKVLSSSALGFPNRKHPATVTEGPVPAGAVKVRVNLSCTLTRPGDNDALLIRKLKLGFVTPASVCPPEGTLVSMPRKFRKAERIRWVGKCPPGTELLFQVATAPDSKGVPGQWSGFTGPEGKPDEWYMALAGKDIFSSFYSAKLENLKHREGWIRWRARLVSNPGAKTSPRLEKVEIAGNLWDDWSQLGDRTEPLIRFCCQSPSRKKRLSFFFQVLENDSIDEKSICLLVDGKPETGFIHVGNSIQYRPKSPWAAGLHKAELTLSDVNGNRVSRTGFFIIGPAERKTAMTVRTDGAVMVNGQFFFPAGVISAAKNPLDHFRWEQTFRRLRQSGVNTAHLRAGAGKEERKEFAEAAEKNQIRILPDLPLPAFPENLEGNLKQLLEEEKQFIPLAWNISSHTSECYHTEELQEVREALKNVVPGSLTAHTDRWSEQGRAFLRSADLFLPEIYTVTGNTPEVTDRCVAEAASAMRRITADLGGGKRPALLPVIQFFEDGKQWKRFPILRELRAMSFAVLCSGANGIFWATYSSEAALRGIPFTEETLQAFAAVAKEVSALADLWETPLPKQPEPPKILSGPALNLLGEPAVVYVFRKNAKRELLIAVNTVNAPVRAEFTLPGGRKTVLDLGPFGTALKDPGHAGKK